MTQSVDVLMERWGMSLLKGWAMTLDELLNDTPIFPQPPSLAAEAGRLSSQCETILKRLQQGPATNRELSEIALKYTSRISDLRKAGYNVVLVSRDASGLATYELKTK